ncbi:hydrogen peroxide-inducible genes activator [Roseomonas sp. CECT 9278]|uniref:hydrogen peroxide-inducible genes activator n=1 Tax=Roseomonas sp. CECT 9278 TaxID=2845823 RepID=UPI001E2851D2|nr:hydrogen peroxide-inducible genes activator [Roseomonas sp. CECT 9278]CAH0244855.1 Hydrogen peroxide-inducible genes activator [Roseomonas sp. CECT 9278]
MIPLPSPQQLRYLVALAEHSHFGRAAAACAVTQSTLSSGILALERQIDAPLLERTGGKRPVFTPLGRDLVGRARMALASLTAFVETVDAAREPLTGSLRLGIIPTIAPFLLPRLMPRLRAAYPRLHLWLREDLTDALRSGLETGRLDLLLVTLPSDCGDAETLSIGEDPLSIACAPGHRLAQGDAIAPAALAGERLLLLEQGHCLRDQALAACGLPAAPLSEEFGATSLHTLVQMAAGGLGVTILPRLALAGGVAMGAEVAVRPLAGGAARRIGLAWRARSPRAAEFHALAPSIAAALADL